LLLQSGVPLELEVATICQRFAGANRGRNARISAQRLVYGESTSDEAYREIDQTVTFYEEIPVTDELGLALHIQVSIECKHRMNTEVFAFPYQAETRLQALMPIVSELAGSRLPRRVASLTLREMDLDSNFGPTWRRMRMPGGRSRADGLMISQMR